MNTMNGDTEKKIDIVVILPFIYIQQTLYINIISSLFYYRRVITSTIINIIVISIPFHVNGNNNNNKNNVQCLRHIYSLYAFSYLNTYGQNEKAMCSLTSDLLMAHLDMPLRSI